MSNKEQRGVWAAAPKLVRRCFQPALRFDVAEKQKKQPLGLARSLD